VVFKSINNSIINRHGKFFSNMYWPIFVYKSLIPINFQYITFTCSTTKLVLFVNTQTCKEEFDKEQKHGRKGMVPISFQNPILKKNQQLKKKNYLMSKYDPIIKLLTCLMFLFICQILFFLNINHFLMDFNFLF
jgi:glutaredoxin-related protein